MLGLCVLIAILLYLGNNFDSILSTMGLFTLAIFRVLPSLNRIATSIQSIRFSMASIDVVAEEFSTNAQYYNEQTENLSSESISFEDEITIRNLSYAFQPEQKNILNNISLTITKNSSVGIIGETGSGKSTLINLLLGLLRADNGEILIDGMPMRSNLRAWQEKIGYVAQNIILLDSSIKRNIAFGVEEDEIDDGRVKEVIKIAKLEKFLENLPDGMNTIIGENGARLSGGQRQRLGIARALYRDSEIIILDEATSALDNETESEFMDTINALSNQKTLIIIAHRLSTLKSCDLIYKLEDGTVLKSGSAEEMLN
jgi:ABC-type multidrug transport system fused ATPase/permease subunit